MWNFCEHGNEPRDTIKVANFLSSRVTIDFPRKTVYHRFTQGSEIEYTDCRTDRGVCLSHYAFTFMQRKLSNSALRSLSPKPTSAVRKQPSDTVKCGRVAQQGAVKRELLMKVKGVHYVVKRNTASLTDINTPLTKFHRNLTHGVASRSELFLQDNLRTNALLTRLHQTHRFR